MTLNDDKKTIEVRQAIWYKAQSAVELSVLNIWKKFNTQMHPLQNKEQFEIVGLLLSLMCRFAPTRMLEEPTVLKIHRDFFAHPFYKEVIDYIYLNPLANAVASGHEALSLQLVRMGGQLNSRKYKEYRMRLFEKSYDSDCLYFDSHFHPGCLPRQKGDIGDSVVIEMQKYVREHNPKMLAFLERSRTVLESSLLPSELVNMIIEYLKNLAEIDKETIIEETSNRLGLKLYEITE